MATSGSGWARVCARAEHGTTVLSCVVCTSSAQPPWTTGWSRLPSGRHRPRAFPRPGHRHPTVKVFISSVIDGYGHNRCAAQQAIKTLGYQAVCAEDLPASAGRSQQACLDAIRDCDLVVLLLGERYGVLQPSGLSASHEEYREVRARIPVLVLVEFGITPEPAQQSFRDEVQAWAVGHVLASYSTAEELRTVLARALDDRGSTVASQPPNARARRWPSRGRSSRTAQPRSIASHGHGAPKTQGRFRRNHG
jgi:Domain of unknown function (DUF4062)